LLRAPGRKAITTSKKTPTHLYGCLCACVPCFLRFCSHLGTDTLRVSLQAVELFFPRFVFPVKTRLYILLSFIFFFLLSLSLIPVGFTTHCFDFPTAVTVYFFPAFFPQQLNPATFCRLVFFSCPIVFLLFCVLCDFIISLPSQPPRVFFLDYFVMF